MNNRRVWDCIRAGGEVIVLLILFYRSLLWVLLIGFFTVSAAEQKVGAPAPLAA